MNPNYIPQRAGKADAEKVLTYAIPCYNSSDYMDHCVQSLIDGSHDHLDKVEILIVDDGSQKDDTAEKADNWEGRYPGVVRAIHQENKGHGGAVNTGIANARGTYYKVIDSDDWVDMESAQLMLELLISFAETPEPIDMVLCNYVYENQETGREVMDYDGLLPTGRVFGWDEIAKFPPWKYILMHSVFYRTQLLRDCDVELPLHTFYVDNVFVYVPLPYVKTMFYLDVDLYRYFIGRPDQSVNPEVMASRVEQQLLVTRVMIDAYNLEEDVENEHLRAYMQSYLLMMMIISSVFSLLSEREDRDALREGVWEYLRLHNAQVYPKMRKSLLGRGVNLKGKAGETAIVGAYGVARKVFKFN